MAEDTNSTELESWDIDTSETKRLSRIATCGKFGGATWSPVKNTWQFIAFRCEQHNDCANCFHCRKILILDNLSCAQKYGKLFIAECNEKQTQMLKKEFEYTAYPESKDLTGMILIQRKGTGLGEDNHNKHSLDFAMMNHNGIALFPIEITASMYLEEHGIIDRLALTPYGRRITGFAAGRRDAVKARFEGVSIDEEDTVIISVPSIISGASEKAQNRAPKRSLFPVYGASSPEEVSQLLRDMAEAHAKTLQDMGYQTARVEYEDQQIKRTILLSNDVLFNAPNTKEVARQAVIAELVCY